MWFTRLPPRSISSFNQLATKFLEQFRMHVARPKDVNTLSSVTQAPGETLRHYLERFHTACAEISNPNDNSILMALTKRIDPDSEFGNWLAGKPPASLDRFHAKTAQFLRRKMRNSLGSKLTQDQVRKGSEAMLQSNSPVRAPEKFSWTLKTNKLGEERAWIKLENKIKIVAHSARIQCLTVTLIWIHH